MNVKDEFGLLPKQRRFADLYLGGMYAAEALRHAGYTNPDARKGAYRMLQRTEVRAYVKAQRERLAKEAGLQRADVVKWLWRVMVTPIGQAVELHPDLIAYNYQCVRKDGRTHRRVRMVCKMRAVKLLVAMMGWGEPEKAEVQLGDELTELIRRVRKGN